jgi:AraC-like DNA-binding protein
VGHDSLVYFLSGGGFALGLFGSTLLIVRHSALGRADRVLAALLIVCSLNIAHPLLGVLVPGLLPADTFGVFEPSEFLFGPLIYAYFRSLLFRTHRLRAAHLLHALPATLSIVVYTMVSGIGASLATTARISVIVWACLLAQMLAYLLPGWRLVHAYRRALPDARSNLRGIDLGWLSWFSALVLALVVSTGVVMGFLVADLGTAPSRAYIALSVSAVTAALALRGLLQVREPAREVLQGPAAGTLPATARPPLDTQAAAGLQERLRRCMAEERPFLDPELSLVGLAARLGVGRNQLSWVINNLEGKRFFDYVNAFRVQTVVEMLKDPEKSGEKLLSLAFDAGFNSKPTFNAAFKKHTGRPPSDFRV